MATVKFAPHIMTVRGSVGNLTYSKNRPGHFMRERVIPRTSQTLSQLRQRQRHANAVDRWRNTLSDAQRVVWNDLALLTVFRSPTCNAYHPSGFSLYVRANVFRRVCSQAFEDVPDTVAAALPPTMTMGADAIPGESYVTADADWHDGKTGRIIFYSSPDLDQSVYYYRGPWVAKVNFAIALLGGLPLLISTIGALPVGKRRWFAIKALYGTQGTIITWRQHTFWDRN